MSKMGLQFDELGVLTQDKHCNFSSDSFKARRLFSALIQNK